MYEGWFIHGVEARKGNQRAKSHFFPSLMGGTPSGCGRFSYSDYGQNPSLDGFFVSSDKLDWKPERCKTCVQAETTKAIEEAKSNPNHDKKIKKEDKTIHLANMNTGMPLCAKDELTKKWYRMWGFTCGVYEVNCKKCIIENKSHG